jgi:predicted CoA-binding protein
MVPVNPRALEALGRRCFARLLDIQPTIDAALLITSPAATEAGVEEAGILWVWMYGAAAAEWRIHPNYRELPAAFRRADRIGAFRRKSA